MGNIFTRHRCLFLLICLASLEAYGQNVYIRGIRLRARSEFLDTKDTTIFYPTIATGSATLDKSINGEIMDIVLPDEDSLDVKGRLENMIQEGLTDISYEVTFNKNGILSINIYSETGGGNRIVRSQTYFNFDILTGKDLSLDYLMAKNADTFQKKVSVDKIRYLKQYQNRELKVKLAAKEIDSTEYLDAIQEVRDNCINSVSIGDFSLTEHGVEVFDPCEFPSLAKWLEPEYKLKYFYTDISAYLAPEFRRRLVK
jgi:hypothetical protein